MPEVPFQREFLGLNKSKPETNLQPNEASEALNISFSRNRVEKRRGSMRISPYLIPKSSLSFGGTTWAETPPISSAVYSNLGFLHDTNHTTELSVFIPSGTSTKTHCLCQRGLSESQGVNGWGLYFYELSHALRYQEQLDAGPNVDFYGTYTAFSPGRPFHVAVVREGAQCRLYVKEESYAGCVGYQDGLTDAAVETATVNTFPVTWGTGANPDDYTAHVGGEFRIQEFRTWSDSIGTTTLSAYALKELPAYMEDDANLCFYYKFNEGSGLRAYDYGKITGYTTATNVFAAQRCPTGPVWVDGLVSGGRGDTAVQFDGVDDFFGVPNPSDHYAVFRTGTSDWSVQAKIKPLDQIKDGSVFLMYGNATHTKGSDGFAFRIEADIDDSIRENPQFVAKMCCSTETCEITWTTAFSFGETYGLTLMRMRDQYWFQVVGEDEHASQVGWETVGVTAGNPAPGFPEWHSVLAGVAYTPGQVIPNTHFAAMELDELRLWKSSRYDDLNTSLGNPRDNDLAGYWKFNEGSGSTAEDSSMNRAIGYLLPFSEGSLWAGGFVTPVSGAAVKGIFQYNRSSALRDMHDSRNMCSLVCAANSIYRLEGTGWEEIATKKDTDNPFCGEQLGKSLILTNGKKQNYLYDGGVLYDAGIDAPTSQATSTVYALATATFDTQTTGGSLQDIVCGQNLWTCRDKSITEQGYSLNGKRMTIVIGGTTGTIEARIDKYFKDRYFKNPTIIPSSTSSYIYRLYHPDFTTTGLYPIQKYGLELGELQVYTAAGNTETSVILSDGIIDTKNGIRTIYTHNVLNGGCSIPAPAGHEYNIRLQGHFIFDATLTSVVYSTSSYRVSLYDSSLEGDFFYRYTLYNRFTDIESNPSPPTDVVVSPNGEACRVTCGTVTNTNVTDRMIYRTKRGGARDGGYYFLLGTLTGTAWDTYNDVTPNGGEGRLISFYRDKPPLASIVKVFKGRMWYVSKEDPNVLYFSTQEKPAEVDPYNYIIFGDESDYITGIGVSYDNIVVFKRHSTWVVSRTDVATGMRAYRISNNIGCVSHHTIKEVGGELLFHAEDGIYSLDGSTIRRVSGHKVQFYFDRLDPSKRYESVATNIRGDGVYRINLAPHATYATTVESGINSWQLDYHYQATADYFSRFEGYSPIWSYGEREVSCYGEYVSEDGTWYPAYGGYDGGVYIDAVKGNYSEGLGWYKDTSVPTSFCLLDGSAVTAGNYTITVNTDLFTEGDGLKGLKCVLAGAGGSETLTVWENTTRNIVFTSPTTLDYSAGDSIFIAPIRARYRSGWQDFGSNLRSKRINRMKIDYRYFSSGTTTVRILTGRVTETARHFSTHSFAMSGDIEHMEFRGSGKDYLVEFENVWPGKNFEIYGWEIDVTPGRQKGED